MITMFVLPDWFSLARGSAGSMRSKAAKVDAARLETTYDPFDRWRHRASEGHASARGVASLCWTHGVLFANSAETRMVARTV